MSGLYSNPAIDKLLQQRRQQSSERTQWRYTNFEMPVPSDHWQEGADIEPSTDTGARKERLQDYLYLFNGDPITPGWLNPHEAVVFKNYFSDVAMLYTDFLMASPPIFYHGENLLQDVDLIPEQSIRSLIRAIERIILDQMRYGTGLANVFEGEVEVYSPIYWYPTGGEDDIIIGPSVGPEAGMTKLHFEPDGMTNAERFERHATRDDLLGAHAGKVEEAEGTLGDTAAWDALTELTEGRRVTLTPCPRDPTDGEWGWRLFEPLAPLAFEYSRRMSMRSLSLDKHGAPILYAVPRDVEEDVVMPTLSGSDELQQVKFVDLDSGLDAWRGQKVGFLPRETQDLVYLHFDGDFSNTENALNEVRRDIISTTRLPASLLGIEEIKLGSGVALRVAHAQTYLAMANMQATLIPKIKRLLLLLAMSAGAGADQLHAFSDELSIEWENPLVFLEEQDTPTQTDDGAEFDDELPDEPGAAGKADPEQELIDNLVVRAAESRMKNKMTDKAGGVKQNRNIAA